MEGALVKVFSISADGYIELSPALAADSMEQSIWLNSVGIGLKLWAGLFEDEVTRTWLRWCDREGLVIPTGAERANEAESKAQRLADRLRSMGINPDEV
jgi:hypothetical protein